MTTPRHPYIGLPDRQFWRNEPSRDAPDLFDPVTDVPFAITPSDRVVTAGSCFAAHVGRHLSRAGFAYHVSEPAPAFVPPRIARDFNYGVFSARYGNVYTPRQLLQLLERAYGDFTPRAAAWDGPAGGVVDPFRPRIQPGGFLSAAELDEDRASHFAAVRRAIEEMDVFVFTLGLTETWEDTRDGAVFPLAPGVAGGHWTPDEVRFRNFGPTETEADLDAALAFIRARNPQVRIVLTVSPVPLAATAVDRHVTVSTTWSKAVLRIAAQAVRDRTEGCAYFPSFEIVTAPHLKGRYWEADGREVKPKGVAHVMDLFLHHFGGLPRGAQPSAPKRRPDRRAAEAEAALEALCDEAAIDNRDDSGRRPPAEP